MIKRVSLVVGALSLLMAGPLCAAKEGWGEDMAKAKAEALASKKYLFLDFTGSDWCSWCKKIDKDIFAKEEFMTLAKEKLVLVEVDFPEGKTLPAAVKSQNEALKQTFKVQGFPTLVLLSPEGKEVRRWEGYVPGLVGELRSALDGKAPASGGWFSKMLPGNK